MFRQLMLAAAVVGALSACSQGNSNKDSNGNCTSGFVDAYNRFNSEFTSQMSIIRSESSSTESKGEAIKSLKVTCNEFTEQHSNVTCHAMINGIPGEADSSQIQSLCKTVSDAAGQIKDAETWAKKNTDAYNAPISPLKKAYEHEEAADANGACTEQFQNGYLELGNVMKTFVENSLSLQQSMQQSKTREESDLYMKQAREEREKAAQACDDIHGRYGDFSCVVEGREIRWADLADNCEKIAARSK